MRMRSHRIVIIHSAQPGAFRVNYVKAAAISGKMSNFYRSMPMPLL